MANPVFAHGIQKVIAYGAETTFGTASVAAGQVIRRNSADLSLMVQPIESQEINPQAQVRDVRQGVRQVSGTLSGQMSPATWKWVLQSLLRGSWSNTAINAVTTDTVMTVVAGNYVLTGSTEHFITTSDYNIGDIIHLTGITGTPSALNNVNLRIIALTDTVMTLSVLGGASSSNVWASGQSVTVNSIGKKLIVPQAASQSLQSWTIETWKPDISQSELFTGCRFTQASINIPASGFVMLQASITGQNMAIAGSQFFNSPTAINTNTPVTSLGGVLDYNGTNLAVVTSMNIQISTNTQADPVVGSNIVPEIFQGMIMVRGSLTCMISQTEDTAMVNDFLNENLVNIGMLLTTGPASNANFINVFLPAVKIFGGQESDSDRALVRNFSFVALEQTAGGSGLAYDDSILAIQDSQA